MHELTLAESMIEIVESAAKQADVKKITRIRLSIGALAHVESDALLYCCDVVSRDSIAEGALFEVERPPGRAQCRTCGQNIVLEHLEFGCPHCSAHDLLVLDGEQMKVVEIGVA